MARPRQPHILEPNWKVAHARPEQRWQFLAVTLWGVLQQNETEAEAAWAAPGFVNS